MTICTVKIAGISTEEATTCSAAPRLLVVGASNGVIRSPNYPRDYPNYADCQWIIDSASVNKVGMVREIHLFDGYVDGYIIYHA